MTRIQAVLLAGVAMSLPMVSVAAAKIAFDRDAPVKSIEAGQTKQDVRSLMGNPSSTRHVAGETHYYYRVEDHWGERAWLDVAFDAGGHVLTKGELRVEDGA